MNEDYERRVRNCELAIIAIEALLDGSTNPECSKAMERMSEAFFNSIPGNNDRSVEFEAPIE